MDNNQQDQVSEVENDSGSDIIFGMMEAERLQFIEQLGDERLDKLTAKEWAGFASMYLLEAVDATPSDPNEGYTGKLVAKQRHMLLKALAITNEAIRRHMTHTGFPLFSTVELERAEKKDEPKLIHLVGKPTTGKVK